MKLVCSPKCWAMIEIPWPRRATQYCVPSTHVQTALMSYCRVVVIGFRHTIQIGREAV